jgi:hypothetical protein
MRHQTVGDNNLCNTGEREEGIPSPFFAEPGLEIDTNNVDHGEEESPVTAMVTEAQEETTESRRYVFLYSNGVSECICNLIFFFRSCIVM